MKTFIDFFAGVGGFRRGMELAGHRCVGFCEFDKFAVASYISMHLITDTQREKLLEMPMKQRQKEISKEEYKNGEWFSNDVRSVEARSLPHADCWCFGFPCQDISIAGKQLGFSGRRSSLFFTVTGLIECLEEKDRPSILFIENVKNLLSVNRGLDFAKLLIELDQVGYDAEWCVLNSKDFGVPQNRQRVFIIGHLRGRGGREIFPIRRTASQNSVSIIGHRDGYRRNSQTYSLEGITEALDTCQGGGRQFNIALPTFCDLTIGGGISLTDNARCLQSRCNKGMSYHKGEVSGVMVQEATKQGYAITEPGDSINLEQPNSQTRRGRVGKGKAQTLTTSCNQAVVLNNFDNMRIRKLTPRECFRLQGWTDEYFDRAAMVSSDSQLYKQAGNGVTVNVIQAIAEKF